MAGPINSLRNIQDVYDWLKNWDQRGEVVDRAGVLPLGTYENGQTTLAWPGFLADLPTSAQTLYDYAADNVDNGQRPITSREAGAGFTLAGSAPMGTAMLGGIADNAVGSAGGRLTRAADLPDLIDGREMAPIPTRHPLKRGLSTISWRLDICV